MLHQHEDAFGNITHSFTAEGPFDKLSVTVDGEVETQDNHGLVKGAIERFPPALFLRETDLTLADPAINDFAETTRSESGKDITQLALLHELMKSLNREITFDTSPTQPATTAAEAFKLRRGVCQDLTHIFIAAARRLGIPARYIGGHFFRADGVTAQEAMTYCCGILVRDGLVMIADTRTNAGLDNVSTFRKLHIFSEPGEAHHGDRLRRQSVDQPVGALDADRRVLETRTPASAKRC
jgi:transglutaminase-like putative cysteine protease